MENISAYVVIIIIDLSFLGNYISKRSCYLEMYSVVYAVENFLDITALFAIYRNLLSCV